jgi:hypothetical protein
MAGGVRKVLFGCLIAVGAFVLCVVLLLVAYGAWGAYANSRAEDAAKALCAATRVGEPIEAVSARAAATDPPPRAIHDGDQHRYVYQGMIFNSRDCVVDTKAERVVARKFERFDD